MTKTAKFRLFDRQTSSNRSAWFFNRVCYKDAFIEGVHSGIIISPRYNYYIKLNMVYMSNPISITISGDVLKGIDVGNATLYIPQGSSCQYAQSPVWSSFGHILEE